MHRSSPVTKNYSVPKCNSAQIDTEKSWHAMNYIHDQTAPLEFVVISSVGSKTHTCRPALQRESITFIQISLPFIYDLLASKNHMIVFHKNTEVFAVSTFTFPRVQRVIPCRTPRSLPAPEVLEQASSGH